MHTVNYWSNGIVLFVNLILALSASALRFICVMCLCRRLLITLLHVCITCYTCLLYCSVESFFIMVNRFSCVCAIVGNYMNLAIKIVTGG